MPIPLKVPTRYAFNTLLETNRGYPQFHAITNSDLKQIADHGLIRVVQLRPFFANNAAYQRYRRTIRVPREDWEQAIQEDAGNRAYATRQIRLNPITTTRPVRSNSVSSSSSGDGDRSSSASPSRAGPSQKKKKKKKKKRPQSRSPSPQPVRQRYRRGELVMKTKLGKLSPAEKAEAPYSYLSVQKVGDECDATDVNLPLPICKGIRKVCRNYNSLRQYVPYKPDRSEQKSYDIKILYKKPPGRWKQR